MSADISFTFYLIGDWTWNYFGLYDGNTRENNNQTLKVNSFNNDAGNYDPPLTELDLSHVYL
jgi:hypothetical protein